MKLFIKTALILFIGLTVISYGQEITPEIEQRILNSLTDSTSWKSRSSAIREVRREKITEAENILKAQIWSDSIFIQTNYLRTLNTINSDVALNYTNKFLSKIDSMVAVNGVNIEYLRYQVEAISILYSLGVYDRIDEIFELIEAEKPLYNSTAIFILKEVIKHRPSYEEQAKNELIDVVENSSYYWYRLEALEILEELYGIDSFPQMAYLFVNDEDSANRLNTLLHMLIKYKTPELNDLLRRQLYNEVERSSRTYIAENLLVLFGSPSDYEYVKSYISSEPNQTAKNLIGFEIRDFKSPEPDGTVTVSTMIDTLISYTDQSYNYEWITNRGIYNSLSKKLENAKKGLEKGKENSTKNIIQAYQNEVDAQNGKHITEDGYKFLYYFSDYIIERLK